MDMPTNSLQTTEARIGAYLRPLGISQPVESFVATVSNLYHKHEANLYDGIHLEIHETAQEWQNCLEKLSRNMPDNIRVLDLGTGTGFAAEQVLHVFRNRVSLLVCQDLSIEMLHICRQRIDPLTANVQYVSGDPHSLLGALEEFDLVVTNAVLHHLVDLPSFFHIVRTVLRPGGYYIAGHEPSADFYANPRVYHWTQRYRVWRKLRRLVRPSTYLRRLTRNWQPKTIEELTNEDLLAQGIINNPLSSAVIRQLVDIHVPPPDPKTPFWGEYGFSANTLHNRFFSDFGLDLLATYPHIKEARGRMGPLWRGVDRLLRSRYPAAGANFLVALRRPQ